MTLVRMMGLVVALGVLLPAGGLPALGPSHEGVSGGSPSVPFTPPAPEAVQPLAAAEARSLISQALALWQTSKTQRDALTETDLQIKVLLEKVLTDYPGTEEAAEALRHVGWVHYYKGRTEEALDYWNRLLIAYPDSPQCAMALRDMADYYFFARKDYQAAADCFTHIIGKFDGIVEGENALIERAFCRMSAYDYEKAAADLAQAAQTDPDPERQAKAVYWLARCYFHLERYPEARSLLERILADSSPAFLFWHDNARYLRAHCFYSEGDHMRAIPALKEVLEKNSDEAGRVCANAMLKSLAGPPECAGGITIGGLTTWNEWELKTIPPPMAEVSRMAVQPYEPEKKVALSRIRSVLAGPLDQPPLEHQLLALRGWEGKNVFFVRKRVGKLVFQIMDDAERTTIEVRWRDGEPFGKSLDEVARWALETAPKVLASDLLPGELRESVELPNHLLAWKPERPRQPDPSGEVEVLVFVHGDLHWVKYVVARALLDSPRSAGAPPYAFGGESLYAPPAAPLNPPPP